MAMKSYFLLSFLLIISHQNKEIIIDYEDFKNFEDSQMRYFYDIQDGYFLQIGGFDPIIISLSHPLISQGWNGITVEANPYTSKNFYEQRIGQQNLNVAAGVEDEMVTLYVNTRPGRSTISKEVKDDGGSPNAKFVEEVKVPGLSLKEICERNFLRKVNFLTIDVEGVGVQVLEGNDWNNPLCVPEFIIAEDNRLNKLVDATDVQTLLEKHGYVHLTRVRTNAVFVLKEMKDYFQEKGRKGVEWIRNRTVIKWEGMKDQLEKSMGIGSVFPYEAHKAPFYFHFCKNDALDLVQVSKTSNMLGQYYNKTQRPIYIFHFNPHKSRILIQDPNYTISKTKIHKYEFYKIKMQNERKKQVTIFILNHHYSPEVDIREKFIEIRNFNEKCSPSNNEKSSFQELQEQNEKLMKKVIELSESEKNLIASQNENNQKELNKQKDEMMAQMTLELDFLKEINLVILFLFVGYLLAKLAYHLLHKKSGRKVEDFAAQHSEETSENL